MHARHKSKAFIGMAAWLVVPFVAALLVGVGFFALFGSNTGESSSHGNATGAGLAVIVFFLVQYVFFFWSCSHLAKAKGYSNGWVVPGILGPLVQLIIYILLLFAMPDKYSHLSKSRQKNSSRHESLIARIVRYRRNALVFTTLGFVGIFLALFLGFVPIGLFATHANAEVAAIFIFVPSYAAVITGCWWWVRAKNWHEAVVFIGLLPLAILLVRYVRLIFIMVPLLLPASMVVMPIILTSVVAVLPDKSGMPKRKRWDRD